MIELLDKNNYKNRREYEDFIRNHPYGNFMQSLKWAKVKNNWEYEAVIIRNEENRIKAAALVLIKRIPIVNRSFLYTPHGPICDYNDRETMIELLDGIEALRRKYKGYQVIMDPCITENDIDEIDTFKSIGLKYTENAPELSTIQARNNYVLNINGRTADELFASFHKKWRYNIRVAEKRGVECKVCGKEALDDFYKLMIETGERDDFCIRGYEYFEKMLHFLGKHCRLYMCYYNGIPLSGAIAVQYAGKTCYVYGASTALHRNVMPNYLMQWNMICWAVESGCYLYDFQGIPFYKDETHPNYGVYRFKRGFNGEVLTYAGEFSMCYSRSVKIIVTAAEKLYRKITGKNPSEFLNKMEKNAYRDNGKELDKMVCKSLRRRRI